MNVARSSRLSRISIPRTLEWREDRRLAGTACWEIADVTSRIKLNTFIAHPHLEVGCTRAYLFRPIEMPIAARLLTET